MSEHPPAGFDGYVEFYGRLDTAGGWIIGGWTRHPWPDVTEDRVHAVFANRRVTGSAVTCFHPRADLAGEGAGFVSFLRRPDGGLEGPPRLVVGLADGDLRLAPTADCRRLEGNDLAVRATALVALSVTPRGRGVLAAMLAQRGYMGQDTLSLLRPEIPFEVEGCWTVPGAGLLLLGWTLDPFGTVAMMQVRFADQAVALDATTMIRLPRHDVQARRSEPDGVEAWSGFIAGLPGDWPTGAGPHVTVLTRQGLLGYRPLSPVPAAGPATLRRLLGAFSLRREALVAAFDVIGPAVAAITAAHVAPPVPLTEVTFGEQPEAPRSSIIVPLHGRIDFMEVQMALLADGHLHGDELIYVVDDPPNSDAAEALAVSCHARFALPFRLLRLARNVGFARACNIGAHAARGRALCFLNSDAFPASPDWLDRLLAALAAPDVGIAGARLLFEDGSLQHDGCAWTELPECGGWRFPVHPGKGKRPDPIGDTAPVPVPAVTGACLAIDRALFTDIGGFAEAYAIGDFEDADLCRTVAARGLSCVVCRDAVLHHLERQSQPGAGELWRHNLTLYNAWQHEQRWPRAAMTLAC